MTEEEKAYREKLLILPESEKVIKDYKIDKVFGYLPVYYTHLRIYRDLRITRISGGTGEIQTVIASRQVLKKYK